jgi:hypothetical protein
MVTAVRESPTPTCGKKLSMATPVTMPRRVMGIRMIRSRARLPGKRYLWMKYAAGRPMMRATSVPTNATPRLLRSAASSDSSFAITWYQSSEYARTGNVFTESLLNE